MLTQLTIQSTISVDTRNLLMELLSQAQQAVQDDILETVSDVKILAAHLNAIIEALDGENVSEPQINRCLCSVLQTVPAAYEFDWQSILRDPDLDPQDRPSLEGAIRAKARNAKRQKTA